MLPSKAKEIFNKEKNEFFSDVANTLIENYIVKSNLVALKVVLTMEDVISFKTLCIVVIF